MGHAAKDLTRLIREALTDSSLAEGWSAEREVKFSNRRIDLLSISPGGKYVVGFEIKVSQEDFRNELRNPEKRYAVSRFCTHFYFVAPRGVIRMEQVPDDCGLIHCDGYVLSIAKKAPGRKCKLPLEIQADDYADFLVWQERRRKPLFEVVQ